MNDRCNYLLQLIIDIFKGIIMIKIVSLLLEAVAY